MASKIAKLRHRITHHFLPQDHITDILVPTGQRSRQLCIELACTSAICGALADLQIDEEFTDYAFSMREHLLAVDLAEGISKYFLLMTDTHPNV